MLNNLWVTWQYLVKEIEMSGFGLHQIVFEVIIKGFLVVGTYII